MFITWKCSNLICYCILSYGLYVFFWCKPWLDESAALNLSSSVESEEFVPLEQVFLKDIFNVCTLRGGCYVYFIFYGSRYKWDDKLE